MPATVNHPHADPFVAQRRQMVEEQVKARGVRAAAVLAAMRTVPRHQFVPETKRDEAYADRALPLGPAQTISQPYIVALMTELVELQPGESVLEIGTGSGYQAAVLAELNTAVYSIESSTRQAQRAATTLDRLCYRRIALRCGDGRAGWPEAAPFDAILVTASVPAVPPALIEQLAFHGRLVVPVGPINDIQTLQLITKDDHGQVATRRLMPVRFVPLA